ncbi:MAG: Na/Pi cotransporter family protein [Magnetococcales bacterium]|nr:Na/Pi cotransporter family protein [Magnetococcales bacterium]
MHLTPFQLSKTSLLRLTIPVVLLIPAILHAASATDPQAIAWSIVIMNLLGGLALFLFGLEMLADSLKLVAGDRMRTILGSLTTNRFSGALTGAGVTAVVQSSSVTTVLVVGFVSAGLMTAEQSLGVIMGANIGSTVTSQLIAFNITKYAMWMVTIGFTISFIATQDWLKQSGKIIMGLGLIFFGMGFMSAAMQPLRSYHPFIELMAGMSNPVLGIAVGALFTALVQSSAATMGIVIVMASQGMVTLEGGIALALGANIGTCATALLASIGKPRNAVRAAMFHILFNIIGVLLWLPIINQLAALAIWISPLSTELEGMARLAAEVPRQIANANTLFNIINTAIFIWLTGPFAKLLRRMIPDRAPVVDAKPAFKPRHLDELLLSNPSIALQMVRMETLELGKQVMEMVKLAPQAVTSDQTPEQMAIEQMDQEVDVRHRAILGYLGKLARHPMTAEQTVLHLKYAETIDNLEQLADVVETNLVSLGRHRARAKLTLSPAFQQLFTPLHQAALHNLQSVLNTLDTSDPNLAIAAMESKKQVSSIIKSSDLKALRAHAADNPDGLEIYAIEKDVLEKTKRLHYFIRRIAVNQIGKKKKMDGATKLSTV